MFDSGQPVLDMPERAYQVPRVPVTVPEISVVKIEHSQTCCSKPFCIGRKSEIPFRSQTVSHDDHRLRRLAVREKERSLTTNSMA